MKNIIGTNNQTLKIMMEAADFTIGDLAEIAPFDEKDIEAFLEGTKSLVGKNFEILEAILKNHIPSEDGSCNQAVIKKMAKRKAGI